MQNHIESSNPSRSATQSELLKKKERDVCAKGAKLRLPRLGRYLEKAVQPTDLGRLPAVFSAGCPESTKCRLSGRPASEDGPSFCCFGAILLVTVKRNKLE
jgi:hypothetical protein